jgi:hypothetical protein
MAHPYALTLMPQKKPSDDPMKLTRWRARLRLVTVCRGESSRYSSSDHWRDVCDDVNINGGKRCGFGLRGRLAEPIDCFDGAFFLYVYVWCKC